MRRKELLIPLASLCILLSGCSSIRNSVEQKMLAQMREKSDISSDVAYEQYQEYNAQGNVVDGYYAPNGKSVALLKTGEEEMPSGIRVTFASNNHLDIRYYYDADFKTQIEDSGCLLSPGSSIYAKEKVDAGVSTNQYHFSSFRIYAYNAKGQRVLLADVEPGNDGLLWQIPENFEENDIVIEPLGKYENRTLSFRDYYVDSKTDKKTELEFEWTVNGRSTTGSSLEINPVQQYTVSYQYDKEKYYYVSSEPVCYSYNDDDGIVYFQQAEPDEENSDYTVELKPYRSSGNITADAEVTYCRDGEEEKREKNKPYVASRLKDGDKITIKTMDRCNIKYDGQLFAKTESAEGDSYVYTLTVQEGTKDFLFDPNAYSFEHGDIVFTYLGQRITEKISLAAGRQIEYRAENVEEGYWLPEGAHTITVDGCTEESIRNIQFYPRQEVIVSLPQPEYGGSITYSINGVKQIGSSVTTYCGTIIQMSLNPWGGWNINGDERNVDYVVRSGQQNQIAAIDDVDLNRIFEESKDHKPALNVKLDKSVGSEMTFEIKTAGKENVVLKYEKGGKAYKNDEIGTAEGITIWTKNGNIRVGKVLKIAVEMVQEDKKQKLQEIYYMEKLPDNVNIPIYQRGEQENAPYYESISITINIVDKLIYQPSTIANAAVTLTAADVRNQSKIQSGDILDKDRRVLVTIKPNTGYYLTGSKVDFNQYQNEMSFEKYEKNISSILSKHPVKKLITVTLDSTDDFGTVEYTLDGAPVSGKIQLREEQKLVMKYKVTAQGYQITQKGKNVFGKELKNPIASKTEKRVPLEVSAALEGGTIRRPDYIQIEKEA